MPVKLSRLYWSSCTHRPLFYRTNCEDAVSITVRFGLNVGIQPAGPRLYYATRGRVCKLCICSFDRPVASSTASFAHSAIDCFLMQFSVSFRFLKVIHWLLTSSLLFPVTSALSFSIVLQNASSTQDMNDPVSLPAFLSYVGFSYPPWLYNTWMPSSGWFPGVCSLNANVSEHCVCSILIGE
jgi:hypothetical protein